MKGKELIGKLVAMPIDKGQWILGMIVDCVRAKSNNKTYYDIEWYSPNGKSVQLIGYGEDDINMFLSRYNDMREDKPADWGAYELFLNEIEDALDVQRAYR